MFDQQLVVFLRGTGRDSRGRYHSDILNFSDEELEETHDYIQWLFPLREPSIAVPGSPFLDEDKVVELLRADARVQENMRKALDRMKRFYADNDFWLEQGNHNHLRITRILKSMMLFGRKEEALDFYDFILQRVESAQPIADETLVYWRESIT